MIVIFYKAFADDSRAIIRRSVKPYLFHSYSKILSSVKICNVSNDTYTKARIKI